MAEFRVEMIHDRRSDPLRRYFALFYEGKDEGSFKECS